MNEDIDIASLVNNAFSHFQIDSTNQTHTGFFRKRVGTSPPKRSEKKEEKNIFMVRISK